MAYDAFGLTVLAPVVMNLLGVDDDISSLWNEAALAKGSCLDVEVPIGRIERDVPHRIAVGIHRTRGLISIVVHAVRRLRARQPIRQLEHRIATSWSW